MNRTEMAKLSTEQKNAQRLSGEGASRMDLLLEGQLDRVEAATRALGPIAESVRILCQEARDTLQGFKVASQDARECLERAREAASAIERRSQRLTLKLWAAMLLASPVVAAVSVSSYSLWQQHSGGDKEAAVKWLGFTARYQQLSPARQRQVDQLLLGTPSR